MIYLQTLVIVVVEVEVLVHVAIIMMRDTLDNQSVFHTNAKSVLDATIELGNVHTSSEL